jgi:hypothetical protein
MKETGYKLIDGKIIINRELTILDKFVKDFLSVLTKYSDYLIVSGFVSISTGRTRATEDVDILIPLLSKSEFTGLFAELSKRGFWCYQSDLAEEAYSYLKKMSNIRFARKNEMFPNIEIIPITKERKAKYYEFTHPQKIKIKEFEFKIPLIEFEILYKEKVLAGKKDMEDAAHLRAFFKNILSNTKFRECEEAIKHEISK